MADTPPKKTTQYQSKCQPIALRSYKCLEMSGGNRGNCEEIFDEYRKCRKEEQAEIVAERRRNS